MKTGKILTASLVLAAMLLCLFAGTIRAGKEEVKVYIDGEYMFSAPSINRAVSIATAEMDEETEEVKLLLPEGEYREDSTIDLAELYDEDFAGKVILKSDPGERAVISTSGNPVLNTAKPGADITVKNLAITADEKNDDKDDKEKEDMEKENNEELEEITEAEANENNSYRLLVETSEGTTLQNNQFIQANRGEVAHSVENAVLKDNTYLVSRCPGFIASGGTGAAGDLPGEKETVVFQEGKYSLSETIEGINMTSDRVTVKTAENLEIYTGDTNSSNGIGINSNNSAGVAELIADENQVILSGKGITFSGIKVTGKPDEPGKVDAAGITAGGSETEIRDCVVAGFSKGILAGSPGSGELAEDILVAGNRLEFNVIGLKAAEGAVNDLVVQNNEILHNTGYGVAVMGQDNGKGLRLRSNLIQNYHPQKGKLDHYAPPAAGIWLDKGTGKGEGKPDRYYSAYILENELVQVNSMEKAVATGVPYSYDEWIEKGYGSEDAGHADYYQDEEVHLRLLKNRNYYSSKAEGLGQRLAGIDRYQTAVEISKKGWEESKSVVLARGDDFPDALAGTLLAHERGAPVLLTRPGKIPKEVVKEIDRLEAEKIYLLGGEAAVSPEVKELLEEDPELEVKRIYGADRYQTALNLAKEIDEELSYREVVLVNRSAFADAVSAGPLSAGLNAPVLPVFEDSLPETVKEALNNEYGQLETVYLAGGENVLSRNLEEELENNFKVERLAGEDRTGTSIEVARALADKIDGLDRVENLYFTCGEDFPDALAGGALAAKTGGAVILTTPHELTDSAAEYLQEKRIQEKELFTLGGRTVVDKELRININLEYFKETGWDVCLDKAVELKEDKIDTEENERENED